MRIPIFGRQKRFLLPFFICYDVAKFFSSFFAMKRLFSLVLSLVLVGVPMTNISADFSDTAGHPYQEAIEYAYSQGIITGYADNTFRPDRKLTRAEFTKIVVEMNFSDREIEECTQKNMEPDWTYMFYPDVMGEAWFAPYVCVAHVNGVVEGLSDGSFAPQRPIRLSEASKIVVNALEMSPLQMDEPWYAPFIATLEEQNAVPPSFQNPDQLVTRAEFVEMMYRIDQGITDRASTELIEVPAQMEPAVSDSEDSANEASDMMDQLPPLIDRELFLGNAKVAYGQISGDGQYFSFLAPNEMGVVNIWVKKIEDDFENAFPVTNETERSIRTYSWARDSEKILYVQDNSGDENYNVYAVDPEGKSEVKALTDFEGVRVYIYEVPKNDPEHILIGINDRDPALHDVYRLNIATGERELIIENTAERNVGSWYFDHDGDLKMAEVVDDEGNGVYYRVEEDLRFSQIYSYEPGERVSVLAFDQAGDHAYIATNTDRDFLELERLSISTGETQFIERDPEGQVDFGGILVSDITDEIWATVYNGDRQRFYPQTDQMRQDWENIMGLFPDSEVSIRMTTDDEKVFVLVEHSDVNPGAIHLYFQETGTAELVYESRPEIPSEHLANMQVIRYMSRDGETEIPAYLTLPKNVEPSNLPLVVNPHGGPQSRDSWGYHSYAQFLANRGYAVLQPNFRGSTGYGKSFQNAGDREFGTGYMQHDITDGVFYLIDEGIVDAERVAIFGGSYGGYATLAGLTFTPDVYTAGISYVGPSNLVTLIESVPEYWKPFLAGWYRRVGNPAIAEEREDMLARSPLFFADQIEAALLVIQGANDPRVTQQESDQIVAAVRDLGHPVTYLLAENEGHGFINSNNRIAVAVAIEQFLGEHLGGRVQEDVPEAIGQTLEELTVDIAKVGTESEEEEE